MREKLAEESHWIQPLGLLALLITDSPESDITENYDYFKRWRRETTSFASPHQLLNLPDPCFRGTEM